MKKILLIIWLLILFSLPELFSQNDTCIASEPFCTGLTITYPAGTSDSAEVGADYGCLTSQPAPAWFQMMVENPGNIMIYMFSTPSLDIDFICWGPFTDPVTPCVSYLTNEKIVDCSFSPNPLEFCEIPYGQTGEYYILLITNYSQSQAEITFAQSSGTGSLNCNIIPLYQHEPGDQVEGPEILAYPNPACDLLYVDFTRIGMDVKPVAVDLISLTGSTLVKSDINEYHPDILCLDIKNLPPAFYLLRIKTSLGFNYRRIIVAR